MIRRAHLSSRIELPLSLASTLVAIAQRRVAYVVERYGRGPFLVRMTSPDHQGLNGTALSSCILLALAKAHSELLERIGASKFATQLPSSSVYGTSASALLGLASKRAWGELLERDALVNFWLAKEYLNDLSERSNWSEFVRSAGLPYDVRVLAIPSHKFHSSVALLTSGRDKYLRLHAVGCSARSSSMESGWAAVQEAVMLALNDPGYSIHCPTFVQRRGIAAVDQHTATSCTSFASLHQRAGRYHIACLHAEGLSGLRSGKAIVSRKSFRELYQREAPIHARIHIPYFTTTSEAAAHA